MVYFDFDVESTTPKSVYRRNVKVPWFVLVFDVEAQAPKSVCRQILSPKGFVFVS